MPQLIPVIGAVTAVGSTALSYNAQRKAANTQERQQALATQRSARSAIREAQIKRASAQASAAALGATGGSAVEGGLSSLGSQLGSGLGFSSQMSSLSGDITNYSARAETFGGLASFGSFIFKGTGGFGALYDTFKKQPTKAPNANPQ